MKTNKTLRLLVLGFITWFVPFVASFGFYDRTGNLNIPYGTFKCIMVVLSSVTGIGALLYHFKHLERNFGKEGFIAGIAWLLVNYLLDIVFLIPMAGMTFFQYFINIGLGYLQVPIICTGVGVVLQRKVELIES